MRHVTNHCNGYKVKSACRQESGVNWLLLPNLIMTGVIDQTLKVSQTIPFLHDGRVFYPIFEDAGESYSKLIEAVQSKSPADELQHLAEKLARENEELTERFSEEDAPQMPRAPQLRYLKLRAAGLLLRDLVRQGWIIQVEHGHITLYSPTAQKEEDPTVAKEIARRIGLFAKEDQLKDPNVQRFVSTLESPGRGSTAMPITSLKSRWAHVAGAIRTNRLPTQHFSGRISHYIALSN